MAFDPDSFLADKPAESKGFDPDAFLAEGENKTADQLFLEKLKAIDAAQRVPVNDNQSTLGRLWDQTGFQNIINQAVAPVVTLPSAPDLSTGGAATNLPDAIKRSVSPLAAGYNAVLKPLAESLSSPLGAATLGMGALPKAARAAIGGGFTALMANDTVEGVKNAKQTLENPNATEQQKIESVLSPAGTAAMTALAGVGTLHSLRSPAKVSVTAQDGSKFSVDPKPIDPALPASDGTKAQLVQLGFDATRLDNVTEEMGQKAIRDALKTQQEQVKTVAQQQKSQLELQGKAQQNEMAAQQPQPQGEAPPEVKAQIEQARKQAQGQAVTDLLSTAGKQNPAASNATANSIATKPLKPIGEPEALPTPAGPENASIATESVKKAPSDLTYDETIKGKPSDYQKVLKEMGVTEEQARAATNNPNDQIPMPAGEGIGVKIAPSMIEGQGLFTKTPAKAGEKLAPALIDGKRTPAGRFTNHARKANADMVVNDEGNIDLVAKRDMLPNTEVTVDYRQARAAAQESIKKRKTLEENKSKLSESNTPIGNLVGMEVEYSGYEGKLIRDADGNFGVLRAVTKNGEPNFVEIADTGKDPSVLAKDVGVVSKLEKSAAHWTPEQELQDNLNRPLKEIVSDPKVQVKLDNEINSYLEGRDYQPEPEDLVPNQEALAGRDYAAETPETPALKEVKPVEDIGTRVPSNEAAYQYRQGLTKMGLGMGKVAEGIKIAIGTIDGNLRAANPAIFGVLRNYEFAKSQISLDFEKRTLGVSRIARKIFSKPGFEEFSRLILSGDIEGAKKLADDHTKYGPQMSVAIDNARQALEDAHKMLTEARGEKQVGYVEDYFPRKITDYNKLREFLGKDEQGTFDAALKKASMDKGRALTGEEKEDVLNGLVSGSFRNGGKPGFLKARTVELISKEMNRFYEPFDVSLENYLRRVTNDVVNKAYFGKFEPEEGAVYDPTNGTFGQAIREEVANGNLTPKAQKIVESNLKARFAMEHQAQGVMADLGHTVRLAQSAAYLGQLTTAVAQFGDAFNSMLYYGPMDTLGGYLDRKITLKDVGIHEGNVETAQFSRKKTLVGKSASLVLKFGVGLSDQFNKGGQANAIVRHYSDIVRHPESAAFNELNRKYSVQFPKQWPKMREELMKPGFRDGKLTPETQFFVFNELADIQPINPSGMAQGYNAAHPLAKAMWGLKSYMIKQLDIMRTQGYEKLKAPDAHTKGQGVAFLAAYMAIVGAGQNFAVSWLRDKMLDRNTDTSDYFIGGMIQPFGVSRYTIYNAQKGDYAKVAAETLVPAFSLLSEGTKDVGKLRDLMISRRDKSGRTTVSNPGDFIAQSELVKHVPLIGSQYYSRFGAGQAKEKERAAQKARGMPQPNTTDAILSMFAPGDKKTDRK